MLIQFKEKPDAYRSAENPRSLTRGWILQGIFDRLVARAYALAATPTIYDGLYRKDLRLDEQGYCLFSVEVQYSTREKKEPEPWECRWSFDTSGGTAKITQAKEHVASYAKSGETAPDHKGAIGVKRTSDGGLEVEGCEVIVPAFKWTENWTIPAETVSWGYSQVLKALTGRTNSGVFRGFAAGEVLFAGGQGNYSTKTADQFDLTLSFIQSDSFTSLTMGDIEDVEKAGWDYLWVEYEPGKDEGASAKIMVPKAVHVDRVYDQANFSILGVGTGALS